jgi:hypothetical protein
VSTWNNLWVLILNRGFVGYFCQIFIFLITYELGEGLGTLEKSLFFFHLFFRHAAGF